MNKYIKKQAGYSLIELILVIVIIGILATVAMNRLEGSSDRAKFEMTKAEMNQLADGIVGNKDLSSDGFRTDFGYVGDIGALPPNLSALVTNPGLATWNGPYIQDDYIATSGSSPTEFMYDEWGQSYSYSGGLTIVSNSNGTITRQLANSSDELLNNKAAFNIYDINFNPPGNSYKDSISPALRYPNGSGSYTTATASVLANGYFEFSSLPIGKHLLEISIKPANDTIRKQIVITPGADHYSDVQYYGNGWGDTTAPGGGGASGSIIYVNASAGTEGSHCDKISFQIENTSGSTISITNLTMDWSSPTTYYEKIRVSGDEVYETESPRTGTGTTATFDHSKTIGAYGQRTITIEGFRDSPSGGSKTDMSNTDITITFSDGSIITFNTGSCS